MRGGGRWVISPTASNATCKRLSPLNSVPSSSDKGALRFARDRFRVGGIAAAAEEVEEEEGDGVGLGMGATAGKRLGVTCSLKLNGCC